MNDQIIEWKDPDGKITKLNFDDDGNLIGTKSKEDKNKFDNTDPNDLNWIYKRHRYYEDLNLNQYSWTTHRQQDGKFHISFKKFVKGYRTYVGTYKVVKRRSFSKKKTAIAYCLKAYLKAKTRQQKVLEGRAKRKQLRLDLKPKLSSKQKSLQLAQDKRKHYEKLQKNLNKKIDKQIKTLKTRIRTYQKKINYYKKREVELK